ncbi:hypothetical protein BH11BAC6_BH11BAC6_04810 [soil metagenome]
MIQFNTKIKTSKSKILNKRRNTKTKDTINSRSNKHTIIKSIINFICKFFYRNIANNVSLSASEIASLNVRRNKKFHILSLPGK